MRQDEIAELLEYGYPINEPSYKKARRFLTDEDKCSAEKADSFLSDLCAYAAYGHNYSTITELLAEYDIKLYANQLNVFFLLAQDAMNHTPTFYNRGYSPEAMARTSSR